MKKRFQRSAFFHFLCQQFFNNLAKFSLSLSSDTSDTSDTFFVGSQKDCKNEGRKINNFCTDFKNRNVAVLRIIEKILHAQQALRRLRYGCEHRCV